MSRVDRSAPSNMVLRAALVLVFGAIAGIAGWWTFFVREQILGRELELEQRAEQIVDLEQNLTASRAQIETLEKDVERKAQRIQELEVRLALLKVDHRVARIEVLDQTTDPATGEVETTVRFVELDAQGEPVGEGQVATLAGNKVYIETLVIKFDDEFVEGGEFLRGTSVCLFRRLFSDEVAPSAGVAIDSAGSHPRPYTGGDSESELFQAELWQRFWDYANDPEAAAERGVRAIHGEAPFVEARPGKVYRVELRASGGLSIQPESR